MKTFVLMMVSLLFAISSEAQNKSFYDFTVKTIDGKDFPLSSLKGKKVLVVNVASKCGLTPQYAQLEKLYEKSLVSGKKLRVIKKASFDDTLITWPNQLLCPLKETM